MAGDDPGDPFLWDVGLLARELCSTGRWFKGEELRNALHATLLAQDVGGEDLLTYEDLGGREETFEQLSKDLNLKGIGQKRALRAAIRDLQQKSKRYQQWKAQRRADPPEDTPAPTPEFSGKPVQDASHAGPGQVAVVVPSKRPPEVSPPNPPSVLPTGEEGPPRKKARRLAATSFTTTPLSHSTTQQVFTMADDLLMLRDDRDLDADETQHRAALRQTSDAGAYLGKRGLSSDAVLLADLKSYTDSSVTIAHPLAIPPGRRLQVAIILSRFLRRTNSRTGLGRGGTRLRSSPSSEEDFLVPFLGESESEDEDEANEIWEEMEEEAAEREARAAKAANAECRHLSKDEVEAVIAECLADLERAWTTKKLPKLEKRHAYGIWTAADRLGRRGPDSRKALREAQRLDRRIDAQKREMLGMPWQKKDLQKQADSFDVTVQDKLEALWTARLLSSNARPAKPDRRARGPARKTVRAKVKDNSEDSDVLTSASEDEGEVAGPDEFVGDDASDTTNVETDGDVVMELDTDDDTDDDGPADSDTPFQRTSKSFSNAHGADRFDLTQITDSPSDADSDIDMTARDDAESAFPFRDPARIAEMGTEFWETRHDALRLVVTMLWGLEDPRNRVLKRVGLPKEVLWRRFCAKAIKLKGPPYMSDSDDSDDEDARRERRRQQESALEAPAFLFARLFDAYCTSHAPLATTYFPLSDESIARLSRNLPRFSGFQSFMRGIDKYFPGYRGPKTSTPTSPPEQGVNAAAQPKRRTRGGDDGRHVYVPKSRNGTFDGGEDEDTEAALPANGGDGDEDSTEDEVDRAPPAGKSPAKRRWRRPRDKVAQDLRLKDVERQRMQEARIAALREQLANSQEVSAVKSRLIINESKEHDQGLIFVNDFIAGRIQDHQIDGVRFMWNQLVTDAETRQGCLLAHTMGLGKTMQVITLLVAIAEAAASDDPTVRSQIPAELRRSKTLILCPASLVENWWEEFMKWTSDSNPLGDVVKLTAETDHNERPRVVRDWAAAGGVLIVGYSIFLGLELKHLESANMLRAQSRIVVADEAHYLRNPNSKISRATTGFATGARIAMTGSPLANSVQEYYATLNWVAPNYLGPQDEFEVNYAAPIKKGLYHDSHPSDRRRAIKMLRVLKDSVAPKVHRANATALKGLLPKKEEYLLFLHLTPLQMDAYSAFIEYITGKDRIDTMCTNTITLWNLIVQLSLLLAHPKVFRTRLESKEERSGGDRSSHDPSNADQSDREQQHADGRAARETTSTLPTALVGEILRILKRRDIEELAHSNKVLMLLAILEEARKLNEKVLVFTQSRFTLDYLEATLKQRRVRVCRLDGQTQTAKRQDMVRSFNKGKDEVFLISTTAGGVGLNVHGASRVVIFDFKWNPVHEQQAIGRAYRMGQTKPVKVYWLIVGGTYEGVLHEQAIHKIQLASRVVDKKNPVAWAAQLSKYVKLPSIPPLEPTGEFRGKDAVLDAVMNKFPGKIYKIMSTDSFEEEADEALTAEELQEAEDMIRLNQLRATDPEAHRLELEKQQQQAALAREHPQPTASAQPRPTVLPEMPQLPPMALSQQPPMAFSQQLPMALSQQPPMARPLPPVAFPPPGTGATDGSQAVEHWARLGRPQFARPAGMPTGLPSHPPVRGHLPNPPQGPPEGLAPRRQEPSSVGFPSLSGLPAAFGRHENAFQGTILKLPEGGPRRAKVQRDLQQSFARFQLKGVPGRERESLIQRLVSEIEGFAAAVLFGDVTPDQLAGWSSLQVGDSARVFSSITAKTYKWPSRPKDPDVGPPPALNGLPRTAE